MAYFLANPGWEKPRKSENKNYRFDHFLPDPQQGIPKKMAKKWPKNKKTPLWLLFKTKKMGKRRERVKKKNYRSDHFLPVP